MSSAKSKCLSMWIHCNKCFENHIDQQRKIYILSCYDLLCEKCIIRVNKHDIKCSICKNIVQGYPIDNDLKKNLKELFHPLPWSLSFDKTWAVLKFQSRHRRNFLIGCKKLKKYTESMVKERDRLKADCRQIYLRQEKLKKEKVKLSAGLQNLKEMNLSKKYAYRGGLKKSQQNSDFMFEMQRPPIMNRRYDRPIPSTCHMKSISRNEDTFDFPAETSLSKSFYL